MKSLLLFLMFLGQNPPSEIDRLMMQSRQEVMRGDYTLAEQNATEALRQSGDNRMRKFLCQELLGTIDERENNLDKAEEWFKATVETLQSTKVPMAVMPALVDLEGFYGRHQNFKQESDVLRGLVTLWLTNVGADSLGTARFQMKLAQTAVREGDYTSADAPLRSALAVYEKSGPLFEEVSTRAKQLLMQTLRAKGKMDEAEKIKATIPAGAPQKAEHPDTFPVLISKSEPQYTERARKLKVSGNITLSLDISAEGKPQNIQVTEPLGEGLDENAVNAVSKWVFKPATKGGMPVMNHATIEVNFRLL